MTILCSIAVAMAAGLLMTRVLNGLKLPDVTAYLIAGILIGPFVLGRLGVPGLGFISYEEVESLELLSELALGFIAFAIGAELLPRKLKSTGRQAALIAVAQACLASVFTAAALIGAHFLFPDQLSLPAAIALGAVASATAPAATLMVVRQYKASGPVTDILLPVVALDDGVGLVLFAVALGVCKALRGGALSFVSVVVNPLVEIAGSLALGALMGLILSRVERYFHSNRNRMTMLIAAVTLTAAMSMLRFELGPVRIGFSSLLTCMTLGASFCARCEVAEELMEREDKWTAPLYCLFFVLSGAALRPDLFAEPLMIAVGLVYILARAAGKYFGARWSARAAGCGPTVVKYLGITLLPQAGVALGMSLTAAAELGADGSMVRSITLFGVLIYELLGPALTKLALTGAGEIRPGRRDSRGRTLGTFS